MLCVLVRVRVLWRPIPFVSGGETFRMSISRHVARRIRKDAPKLNARRPLADSLVQKRTRTELTRASAS